jgi:hypothetical protein
MRKIWANLSRTNVIWGWAVASVFLVTLHSNQVCAQYRPFVPSGQDIALAKASAAANDKARWWTSGLVLVAFGGLVICILGRASRPKSSI